MRVALYCRVSTDEQAINGYSIQAQLNELREYSKKHKYTIVNEYLDEGYSGGLLDRPGLNSLLNDIKQDKIELVLFIKLDRWFRSVPHYYKIQEILEQHNCNWCATQEDYETITSSGKFKVNIMLSVAQQFKDATSERINTVFDYKIRVSKEVTSGTKIYGYDIVNKHYVINEKEASNIRLLFNKYIETNSIRKVGIWWNDNVKKYNGRIGDYLKNKKYIGQYEYKGIIYTDYIPKIVDEDIFNKVQNMLKNNIKSINASNGQKRYYIYSGLLECYNCHHKLSGTTAHDYKYYRCKQNYYNHCNNSYKINEEKLEKIVIEKLMDKCKDGLVKVNNAKQDIPNEIDNTPKIKSKIERLKELYIDGEIDKIVYKSKLDALNKELEEQKKKHNNKLDKDKLEYIASGSFLDYYNKLDDEHKLLFNREVIRKIVVKDNYDILIDIVD